MHLVADNHIIPLARADIGGLVRLISRKEPMAIMLEFPHTKNCTYFFEAA